jgi:DNA-binding beta-propeller fold protein YncE
LFNGRDLNGWTNVNCAQSTWSVRDDLVVSTGVPTGVLRTLREFENFIVELEWKHIVPGGNAGFFVHSGALPVRGQPFTKAIEIQILDRDHPEGIATGHGDVFSIQGATFVPDRPHPRGWMRCLPSERRAKPAGEWNHYRVECRDGRVKLAVNGKEVSGGYDCNPRKGFICLESEGSECHFRNLRIQELTPSREPAADTPDLDFVSLYSGVDLSGWKAEGAADKWAAKDWILQCAAGDGVLWSERQFGDFEFIIDWRPTMAGAESAVHLRGRTNVKLADGARGWNRSRISLRKGKLTTTLNDKLVSELELSASFRGPIGLQAGQIEFANLYIKELPTGAPDNAPRVTLVAGGGEGSNNIAAKEAKLRSPFGVDFDPFGNMYIIEMTGERLLKVDSRGTLSVIAGTGEQGSTGDDTPLLRTKFNGVHNLAVAPNGEIYLADTWNNRIRKIDPRTGTITTIAGTGAKGFSGDSGPAIKATFGGIYCASLDRKGENLYLADLDNRRIRVVNLKTGMVRTVAGNGQKGAPSDEALAVDAPLVDPRAVIASDAGEIYILERSGHALRFVDGSGRIRTVAGNGQVGNSGDGGNARQATFNGPKHLCFDSESRVIIADTENHVIRRYDPKTGAIERIAGSGKRGRGGLGGLPLDVELNQPHGVYQHKDGTLYISDSSNDRVLKITP